MRQGTDEAALRARRERLVDSLSERGYVTAPAVLEALKAVRRHLFVPERNRPDAYDDRPLDIGEGQTISAPHMVGIMAEKLCLSRGQKVLEIGGGSGYHAAVVAHIVGPEGQVFSVERIASLAERARRSLEEAGYSRTVTMVVGDGTLGLPEHAPYDRIFVAAASPGIPPPLFEQLREGGRMLVPVGDVYLGQELVMVEKIDGRPVTTEHGGCVFVPLIGEHGFRR
jgi:protein-L-isoaspartate(D-aspartate) O-methyltransferase